jgi:serine/threonine protein phosphatase PrpC
MILDVKAYGVTDIGRRRKLNEDALIIAPEIGLYAVADGVGGNNAGEVASERALAVVRAFLAEQAGALRAFAEDPSPVTGAAATHLVEAAIQAACADIHAMGERDPRLRGMGTTVVCLVVAGERAVIAHVGDSRLYLHRRGALHALTEDHTLVAEQLRAGAIKPEDAPNSPFKGVLTRALGQHESVQVDAVVIDLYPGDAFLLCSDGLSAYFSEDELGERFAEGASAELPAALVSLANERGGKDNVSALTVFVEADEVAEVSVAPIDVIRKIPLFEQLTYREQHEVLAVAHTRVFPAGATVVREGDPGGDLFVLLEGRVSVEQGGLAIAGVTAGGHFGEMGLVDAGPRSSSVRALEPLRALVIHRDAMLALMQREPTLAMKMLWAFVQVLSQRLRATSTELTEVLSSGTETTKLGSLPSPPAR